MWNQLTFALVKLGADKLQLEKIKCMDLTRENSIEGIFNSEAEKLKKAANQAFSECKYFGTLSNFPNFLLIVLNGINFLKHKIGMLLCRNSMQI